MSSKSNSPQIIESFPDVCILGNGTPDKDGYIRIGLGIKAARRNHLLHRIIYRDFWGEIPNKHVIMHTCDNPPCINPKHLRAGTHDDNMRDMSDKRRHEWGEDHYNSKLTAEQVIAIRSDKRPHWVIAEDFGITRPTVSNIKARRIWKHLEG